MQLTIENILLKRKNESFYVINILYFQIKNYFLKQSNKKINHQNINNFKNIIFSLSYFNYLLD